MSQMFSNIPRVERFSWQQIPMYVDGERLVN